MIFNWKITAVPSWNCLFCLLVVYNRAVIKISQTFSLIPSHPCYPADATGVSEGTELELRQHQRTYKNSSDFFFNVSWFYFKMLVWIILPNEHFFMFSVMFFFNIWIWNFIQHLLHHILPDFFLLASCPIYLMLNDTFYFEDRIAMCVFQLRSYETILYVLRHWLTL